MKTKNLIQISIPQQGASPLVLCFSSVSSYTKYIEENNITTYFATVVQLVIDENK